MRLMPLRSPPARPRTGSVRIHPRKRKEDQKQRQPGRLPFVEPSPRSAALRPVREAEHGLGFTRASAARDPLLIFFFFSVGGRPPKSVRGRSGWVRGGVSRMDAAAKPPGTDSRRPPRTQPDRPTHGFCFSRATRHHPRGAAPLAGITRDAGSTTDSSAPAAPAASPAWPSFPSHARRPSHAIPHRARQ